MTTLERVRAEIAEFEERIADLPNMADAYAAVWHCLELIDKYAEQEPTSPCDLCVFNPPSSCDGKPCTMCPAAKGGE